MPKRVFSFKDKCAIRDAIAPQVVDLQGRFDRCEITFEEYCQAEDLPPKLVDDIFAMVGIDRHNGRKLRAAERAAKKERRRTERAARAFAAPPQSVDLDFEQMKKDIEEIRTKLPLMLDLAQRLLETRIDPGADDPSQALPQTPEVEPLPPT